MTQHTRFLSSFISQHSDNRDLRNSHHRLRLKTSLKLLLSITVGMSALLFMPVTAQNSASSNSTASAQPIHISQQALARVGEQIYQNETGGKLENLVSWNVGENFPSLGIGHFIWYKAGERDKYEETFPALVAFLRQNGVPLPALLQKYPTAPWPNREAFNQAKARGELQELTQFLANTKDYQTLFIFQRLQNALGKMKAVSQYPDFIEIKFYEVANAQNGLYALIDYVNFKGEGINTNERYQGEGWGLMQVLENMALTHNGKSKAEKDQAILADFRRSAEQVLTNRVNNADPAKGESRWLAGWKNRIQTYQP